MSTRRLLGLSFVVALCGAGGGAAAEGLSEPLRPKPWGVGATYYYQTQPYGLDSLTLGLPPGVPQIDASVTEGLDVRNTTEVAVLTVDRWVLPFLDLQVMVGRIETETKVPLSTVDIGLPLADLVVKSKGIVYGGGATLAYGVDRFFGTMTVQYTAALLDEDDASVKALVLSPRLGAAVFGRATVYVGAMYQRPSEKHAGQHSVPPLGSVEYSVKLTSSDRWSGLAGATFAITPHWVLTAEGGFGKRHTLLTHLDYRF